MATATLVDFPPLVTSQEIADQIQVSRQTVDLWRKRGLIPFIRIGNVIRFDKQAVLKALGS